MRRPQPRGPKTKPDFGFYWMRTSSSKKMDGKIRTMYLEARIVGIWNDYKRSREPNSVCSECVYTMSISHKTCSTSFSPIFIREYSCYSEYQRGIIINNSRWYRSEERSMCGYGTIWACSRPERLHQPQTCRTVRIRWSREICLIARPANLNTDTSDYLPSILAFLLAHPLTAS